MKTSLLKLAYFLTCIIVGCIDIHGANPSDPTVSEEMTPTGDEQQADTQASSPSPQSGDDDENTLLNGVIPLSPQAAALARYAEYPVSHTTGVPEISIPLYTIKMGGYELPISISYHASGARVTDIPTSVGLGWTLNAGGAITRTILGQPDFFRNDAYSSDYRLFDYDYIGELKEKGLYGEFWEITHNNVDYDTESDRYCFNVGKHTGVFRYSYQDRDFYVLNHSAYHIEQSGAGLNSEFRLYCPDNTEYVFSEQEGTGVDPLGEGNPYTTAWYVSEAITPWGSVEFTYRHGQQLDIRSNHEQTISGPHLRDVENQVPETDYSVKRQNYSSNCTYEQTLIEKIVWNGNSIRFDYEPYGDDGIYTDRLVKMTVTDNTGNVVKVVSFGNDDYWLSSLISPPASLDTRIGRRMLSTLDDSENGIYKFSYNRSILMPSYEGIDAAKWSDLWGYYRGERNDYDLTYNVIDKLLSILPDSAHTTRNYADRSPVLEATKAGVLDQITFPTEGRVKFNYELNSFGGKNTGGLRLASQTIYDGTTTSLKSYSYIGTPTQEDPEDLMVYKTYQVIYEISYKEDYKTFLTATPSPIFSSFQPGNYISYTTVREKDEEGRETVYYYDPDEAVHIYGVFTDGRHPSRFEGNLFDKGTRQALLVRKETFDKDGTLIFKETREYDGREHRSFSTGVRTIGLLEQISYYGKYIDEINGYLAFDGPFQYSKTTATIRSSSLKKVTQTDLTTGVSTTTEYTYDPQLRTTQPRSKTVINSDGTELRTVYEYPFDRTDAISVGMMAQYLPDYPLSVKTYAGSTLLSTSETEYAVYNDNRYYPVALYTSIGDGALYERERITAYNSLGRPLCSIKETTDSIRYVWNSRGDQLLSTTSGCGLRTTYTHKGLFGVSSITNPNGYKVEYAYNSAGMLQEEKDHLGTINTYSYSISNHSVTAMTGADNSVTVKNWLNSSGSYAKISRQYCDRLGRPDILAAGGTNTTGTYLYSGVSYDGVGRETEKWLPAEGSSTLEDVSYRNLSSLTASTYGDTKAYSTTTYDGLDRATAVSTPGEAWHNAGKGKTSAYLTNKANDVRLYRAPVDAVSLTKDGYYPAGTLSGVKSVDEDGKILVTFTDKLGRKVLERRGIEAAGYNDTYYVYNALGQLRYVLSPEYQNSGYKEKYAYEYRYDDRGNVVKKFVPDCGYTQYWYDRAGHLIFMQDETLRAGKLYRFYLYDRAGRECVRGVCVSCNRGDAVNYVDYTGQGGFQSTGYQLSGSSALVGVSLESVTYYDDYRFASTLDSRLVSTAGADATGLATGTVVWTSEGERTLGAVYYDLRGNVVRTHEISADGKLRTTVNSYTYTNTLSKSTMTEDGGLTVVIDNAYDSRSGLLLTTDMTVNGVKQRVSSRTYDSLGRLSSDKRGDNGRGGTVSYSYLLNGMVSAIEGPGFTQRLHYTDGPGTPLYNGSVSSYVWTMGDDSRERGYVFDYDALNRLTLARYGEHADISTNPNRYTEKVGLYSTNSMIRRFQRHGLKANGVYGKIDNLHVSLDGNRIKSVLEDAPAVTTPGSMDFAGMTGKESTMTYDAAGNMITDSSRGISLISYDNSNRPISVLFEDGNETRYVYSAAGEKLRTVHLTAVEGVMSAATDGIAPLAEARIISRDTTDYRGSVVYRNGRPDMLLFDGGYVTFDGGVTYHYYTRDYLGSNRAVTNGTTGLVEQTVAYYPFGGVIADLGTGANMQPYKFSGKELDRTHGLNEYDFSARRYLQSVPTFTQPDELADSTVWVSPYCYCAGNPIINIDRDGRIFETAWDIGNVIYDIGTAIHNHITGDHDAAKDNWVDAGFDTASAFIPGVPAGASKATRYSAKVAEYRTAITQLNRHHLIPKAVYKDYFSKLSSFIVRDSGKNIKRLPNKFHQNHPAYSKWIETKLENIIRRDGGITQEKVDNLIKEASQEINKAYDNFKRTDGAVNMNSYFKNLLEEMDAI